MKLALALLGALTVACAIVAFAVTALLRVAGKIDSTTRQQDAFFVIVVAFLAGAFLLCSASFAPAHDSWISRGALKNAAGEWCCGDIDCPVLNYTPRVTVGGYQLDDGEVVPFSEAMPSPDGTYVRCHRPDGSRRCFFAPPPNT